MFFKPPNVSSTKCVSIKKKKNTHIPQKHFLILFISYRLFKLNEKYFCCIIEHTTI